MPPICQWTTPTDSQLGLSKMVMLEASLAELIRTVPQFKPTVWFDREMDQLVCLQHDCSFRADRIDPILTLLWHPVKDEIVGVKLKGIRSIFEEIVKAEKYADRDFMPLVDVIGGVMLGIMVSNVLNRGAFRRDLQEWRTKYIEAERAVDGVEVPTNLEKIALAA